MAINDVSLTSGMRSNLLSLQGTVDLLNRTQNRLSSGKKVNSAIDNPVSFFASQALTARASTIDALKDGMGQAIQTIQAADKGIKAITGMIEQAKGIAQAALSAPVSAGADAGKVTVSDGLTAAGTDTGRLVLNGVTAQAKDTYKITFGSVLSDADTIKVGGTTFTAEDTAPTAAQIDVSGTVDAMGASLETLINTNDWSDDVGGATYHADYDAATDTMTISKTLNATGKAADMVAGDIVEGDATHSTAAAVDVAPHQQITIGGLDFTAVAENPVAANGEFIASGNDAADMASLANAINNADWAGAGAFKYAAEVTVDENGVTGISVSKSTLANAAVDFVTAADYSEAAGIAAAATMTDDLAPGADTFRIGSAVEGLTFTGVAANPDADAQQFLVTGDKEIDMLSLRNAINATDWSTKDYAYTATVSDGALNLSKTITAHGVANVVGLPAGTAAGDAADLVVANDFLFTAGAESTATAEIEGVEGNTELANYQAQYNEMRNQITELAEDSGYKGKNLLSGTDTLRELVVQFEGTTLTVNGFNATAGDANSGLKMTEATWTTGGVNAISTDLEKLDNALSTIRQNSSALSGNLSIITVRNEFSTNMINTLTEGSDKLTLADANEEGANMLMLQTRQTLSTTALSLSAQAAQSVLRLFQ